MNSIGENAMQYYSELPSVDVAYDREARLRSIAMNAVREAMIAYGRFDKPFTDNDAAIAENIFKIIHLREEDNVDRSVEHHDLSDHAQKPPSPALAAISSMLDKIHDEAPAEVTPIVKGKNFANKASV
jgi:hypothetical protein